MNNESLFDRIAEDIADFFLREFGDDGREPIDDIDREFYLEGAGDA